MAGFTVGTMTALENRPNTALLVIDPQNGVVTGTLYWAYQTAPGRAARAVETGDVHFSTGQ